MPDVFNMLLQYLKSFSRRRCRVRLRSWLFPILILVVIVVWYSQLETPPLGDDMLSPEILPEGLVEHKPRGQINNWVVGKQLLAHTEKGIAHIREFLPKLYPTNWGRAKDADEMVLETQRLLMDLGYHSAMSCREIDSIQMYLILSTSERKHVDIGILNKKEVVLKTQGRDLSIKVSCMQTVYDATKCMYMGNYRLLREVLFHVALKSAGISQQLGYCLRGDRFGSTLREKGVILVVEMGYPLSTTDIVRYSWAVRIEVLHQMALILSYLEHSPLGSVRLQKLNSEDFVIVGDQVKLADLDDIYIDEYPCSVVTECYSYINGREIPGVHCHENRCQGLNAKLNLKLATDRVLIPLMNNPPNSAKKVIGQIQGQLQTLEMTSDQLADMFNGLLAKAGSLHFPLRWYIKGRAGVVRPKANNKYRYRYYDNNMVDRRRNYNQGEIFVNNRDGFRRSDTDDDDNEDDNNENSIKANLDHRERFQSNHEDLNDDQQLDNVIPKNGIPPHLPAVFEIEQKHSHAHFEVSYFRYNASNLPGMFDYPCYASRATWGCVKTAYNVSHAKQMCTLDSLCKAFIILSGRPDTDNLLTVIYKNSSKSTIHKNVDTTLFIKVSQLSGNSKHIKVKPIVTTQAAPAAVPIHGFNIDDCVAHSQATHQLARKIREKRLMYHMGLRGVKEDEWQLIAKESLVRSAFETATDGEFMLQLHNGDQKLPFQSVIFKAKKNAMSSYVGKLVVHGLDRLLGLYHTPPITTRKISSKVIRQISKDSLRLSQLLDLTSEDGTLEGFVEPPRPSSVSLQTVSLQPVGKMATTLTEISKADKLFLEYALIVWLAKIHQQANFFMGTKGHVIHFGGSQAFTEYSLEWLDYFNHCRFPNIAYKTMTCFRCSISTSPVANSNATVCGLGEQLFKELQKDNIFLVDVYRKGKQQILNIAAGQILTLVDRCIKKHGRKNVLY